MLWYLNLWTKISVEQNWCNCLTIFVAIHLELGKSGTLNNNRKRHKFALNASEYSNLIDNHAHMGILVDLPRAKAGRNMDHGADDVNRGPASGPDVTTRYPTSNVINTVRLRYRTQSEHKHYYLTKLILDSLISEFQVCAHMFQQFVNF